MRRETNRATNKTRLGELKSTQKGGASLGPEQTKMRQWSANYLSGCRFAQHGGGPSRQSLEPSQWSSQSVRQSGGRVPSVAMAREAPHCSAQHRATLAQRVGAVAAAVTVTGGDDEREARGRGERKPNETRASAPAEAPQRMHGYSRATAGHITRLHQRRQSKGWGRMEEEQRAAGRTEQTERAAWTSCTCLDGWTTWTGRVSERVQHASKAKETDDDVGVH